MSNPSKPEGKIVGFLVELDALWDTRLTVVDHLDGEAATRLLANPAYFRREVDKMEPLCGLDEEIYQEAWKRRTIEDIKGSINTPVTDLVHYMLVEVESLAMNDPVIAGARLDINTYPYQFTDDERRMLALSIAQRAGWKSPIRVVNLPPAYFTPNLVKQEYHAMVLYNHNAWFEAHQDELFAGEYGIPGVTLYAPRLAIECMPPASTYDLSSYGVTHRFDIFDAIAHVLSQYIAIQYLPIDQFCLAWPGINGPEPAPAPASSDTEPAA